MTFAIHINCTNLLDVTGLYVGPLLETGKRSTTSVLSTAALWCWVILRLIIFFLAHDLVHVSILILFFFWEQVLSLFGSAAARPQK